MKEVLVQLSKHETEKKSIVLVLKVEIGFLLGNVKYDLKLYIFCVHRKILRHFIKILNNAED